MPDEGSRPLIARIFASFPPGRVLDFGGGNGQTAEKLAAAGHDVTVMDFDDEVLAQARARGLKTAQGDETTLDTMDETFDYALLSHVVEHVQCPHETLLPRVHNRLKEGGRVVIAVPNAARLRNRIGLLLGHFSDGMLYQHVRFFTEATLRAEIEKAGFRVIAAHAHGYGTLTNLAMKLTVNAGDELIMVAERPPGPLREIPTEQTWGHSTHGY